MVLLIERCGVDDLTWPFACGLIDGVEATHLKGLVHGDLVERHLQKTASGDPAIIDYGEARPLDTVTSSPRSVWEFRGHAFTVMPVYRLYALKGLHRLYILVQCCDRLDCLDDAGTVKFASDALLAALLDRAPNPQLIRSASHDWVALVRTFYGILHPTAVQPLLNLQDSDIQVHFTCPYRPCQPHSAL